MQKFQGTYDIDRAPSLLQTSENDEAVVEALRARRQVILDNIRENDETGVNYQKVIHLRVIG